MNLFAGPKPDAAKVGAIKGWVRETFSLDDDVVVLVTELRCTEPGCPPLETVVAILDAPGVQRQFKLHKSVADVAHGDVAALKP